MLARSALAAVHPPAIKTRPSGSKVAVCPSRPTCKDGPTENRPVVGSNTSAVEYPGVPGDQGGKNRVRAIDLRTGALRTIHTGDPEPTDVAVARNGNLYWTCTSAGVIVEAKRRGGRDGRH